MEKSPHFKPDQCALLLIDHQVGTIQLIKNITCLLYTSLRRREFVEIRMSLRSI